MYIKNYKSHKKSSFPDILICVDLALKMGNQQDKIVQLIDGTVVPVRY